MITTGFGRVDYCDAYWITASTDGSPEEIAAQLFDLPKWVGGLMNLRNRLVRPFGLKTEEGVEPVTLFPVIGRNDHEIIMGMVDKHLDFRVSVLIDRGKAFIYVTTIVHYHNRWGKAYFLLIKPFHRLIVHSIMRKYKLHSRFYH
jgi:hypothetical protein